MRHPVVFEGCVWSSRSHGPSHLTTVGRLKEENFEWTQGDTFWKTEKK